MKAILPDWIKNKKLSTVNSEWSRWSESSGIYIVSRDSPVDRVFEQDSSGILYIGKAKNLRERVHQFYRSDHNASWFLYCHRDLARKYISSEITDHEEKVAPYVGQLNISYAEANDEAHAEEIERVAIFSYVKKFGEVPPLNNSIPDRYSEPPNDVQVKWFIEQSKKVISI